MNVIRATASDIFEIDLEPIWSRSLIFTRLFSLGSLGTNHRASLDTTDDTTVTTDANIETSADSTEIPQNICEDLEKLDIHVNAVFHACFQHGCRDLVTLWVYVDFWDPEVVIHLMDSFSQTLRHMDLECATLLTEAQCC